VTSADGLRERKKADTRRALSAAAVQLCLERGYHHVTVSDIADAVGVSRRTFSNYFPGKAECVTAFGESVLDDMLDVVGDAGQVHLDDLVRHVFSRYAERLETGLDAYFLLMQSEDDLRAAALAADSDQLARVGDALAKLVGAEAGDLRTQAAAGSAALIRTSDAGTDHTRSHSARPPTLTGSPWPPCCTASPRSPSADVGTS